jgi:hypothetical protein
MPSGGGGSNIIHIGQQYDYYLRLPVIQAKKM